MKRTASILALATVIASPALAQDGEIFEQGEYVIEGVITSCEVQTIAHRTWPLLIEASEDGFQVHIDTPDFDALPPGVRLFMYYHTCTNIFFGDPATADYYAARVGLLAGWLSVVDIQAICETPLIDITLWPEKPDADRCQALYAQIRDFLAAP